MISVATKDGVQLKAFPQGNGSISYHGLFGFVSAESLEQRIKNRRRHGLKVKNPRASFGFDVLKNESGLKIEKTKGCQAQKRDDGIWEIKAPEGEFIVSSSVNPEAVFLPQSDDGDSRTLQYLLAFGCFLFLILAAIPKGEVIEEEKEVEEPVAVKIAPMKETVTISMKDLPPEVRKARKTKRAIRQNLGFLSVLGNKNLKKALGGAPTKLKDASAGAGMGGTEGSGGELLVGLGEGLTRTTVGNSGVKGLGGVGTKGRGGGKGGYGNSMIGSGEGRALSAVALSNDIYLDGGLDRAVVRATIAKYLSQVRACYEDGLKRRKGMSGIVNMKFEIGAKGILNYARVGKSSLGDRVVEKCISNRMMSWKFPVPRGKMAVKVSYPFLLRPTGSG